MADALAALAAWDQGLALWAHGFIGRWPLLDLFVAWLLKSHLPRFVPFVVAACGLWFVLHPQRERNRPLLLQGLAAAFVALVVARALALLLPFRERPFEALQLAIPVDTGLRTWSSFPSDHAVLAFALATALWRVSRGIGAVAFAHAVVLVCLPRVYIGFHYASDIVAGALIGLALAAGLPRLPPVRALATGLLDLERRRPAWFNAGAFLVLFEVCEMFDSVRIVAANAFRLLRSVAA